MLQDNAKSSESILQGIKDRNDAYLTTIHALHAFIYAIRENLQEEPSAMLFSIGRRMHYVSNEKEVLCTPDLVVQLGQTAGIVGEAKLLICKNIEDRWNQYLEQLKKYDTNLIGWWTNTEHIGHTSLVWITELTFSAQLSEYLREKIEKGDVAFECPFALIESVKHQRAQEFLFLRMTFGSIPYQPLATALKQGLDISLERIVLENREKKFYDAKPSDIEYIMEILWQNIFTPEAFGGENENVIYDASEKIWRIPVDLDELTKKVQRLYGSVGDQNREVEYPRTSWIKDALDEFVSIGLAQKQEESRGYIIFFKRFTRPLDRFVSLIHKRKKKQKAKDEQLELFPVEDVME